jgi:predicted transposase YbfD/YdcC
VSFNEDNSKVRKNNAPENLNILRKIALKLLRDTTAGKKLRHSNLSQQST